MDRSGLNKKIKDLISEGFFPVETEGENLTFYIENRKISPLRSFLYGRLPNDAKLLFEQSRAGSFFSPRASAKCLDDGKRTQVFYEAVQSAVISASKNKPEGKIYVLDAGCGSFPILSIAAALACPLVRVYAVEGNKNSCEIARTLVKNLGLSRQVQIIHDDVLNFTPNRDFDILVSETMFSGLLDEPIAQIMHYLKRFTRKEAYLLPESCKVALATTNYQNAGVTHNENAIIISNKFYKKINKELFKQSMVHKFGDMPALVEFEINGKLRGVPFVASPIKVFGDFGIDFYDSLISAPIPLTHISYRLYHPKQDRSKIIYGMGTPYIYENADFY